MTAQPTLVAVVDAFRAALERTGRAGDARLFETHISLVLAAGDRAYKFKKPVDFGFIDFSTLEKRRYYCEREVALNRRFAPGLYLGVEPIFCPRAAATPCEYAVCMRRFAEDATLDVLVARGAIDGDAIAALARRLAALHAAATPAAADSQCGEATLARAQIEACLEAPLAALLPAALIQALRVRLDAQLPALAARRADGFVRDCHGDLHLGNVVRLDDELLPFDCIEFNDELRVIDTLSDAAFLLMDLDHHGAPALGHAFLNAYLEASGDYPGLALLPLYLAYRSLVRAKVAMLRAGQEPRAAQAASERATSHVALAGRYLLPAARPGLVITHGLSGSGKTHHARILARERGFVHLRSDLERRRLAGLPPTARSDSALDAGLYTRDRSQATYARLLALARVGLTAGFSVVADATFLQAGQRQAFRSLALECDVPFHILACNAPEAELRRRIAARAAEGADASEATIDVLEQQLRAGAGLDAAEAACTLTPASIDRLGDDALGRARPH